MKTFFITLLANVTALLIVGSVGFLLGTQYIDSKLGPINTTVERVSSIVETGNEKLEVLTNTFESSIGRIDEKVTNTETFQRFFPTK